MEENKKSVNPFVVVAIVAVLAMGVAALVRSEQNKPADVETMTKPTVAVEPSLTTTNDVVEIQLEAGAFYYKPEVITVKSGTKVRIVMKSVDMMHDFVIDELGVKLPIVKSGDTGSIEFVAQKPGTFEYYCSVGQHRKNGQVGKLVVE